MMEALEQTLAGSTPRIRVPLDRAGWRWAPGRLKPAASASPPDGRPVLLPHCWTAVDECRPGIRMRRGWATYSLDFNWARPPGCGEWRLRCDGFYGAGRLWINRYDAGCFNGDYLGLDIDITAGLRPGINRLILQVNNRFNRNRLPGLRDPDFHLYGGLGGNMRLEGLPSARLVRADCRVLLDDPTSGAVRIVLGMINTGSTVAACRPWLTLDDPAGARVLQQVAETVSLTAGGGVAETVIRCRIPDPQLWSPAHPHCYQATASLRVGDCLHDRLCWTFGLRTIRFEAGKGCLINNRPVVLRGVNRHENLPGFGFALPERMHIEDAEQIRAMGLNFVRLSHYPQSPAFLDACDRLGILVYAELCSWKRMRGGGWLSAAEAQLRQLIRRDRHHPSVILWGLGNEGRNRRVFRRLAALAGALDPSRPTIYAENHLYRARRRRTLALTDVWGLNYEFNVLDAACKGARSGCLLVSECANLPFARRGHLPAEAQQLDLIRTAITRTETAGPDVTGWALWCLADYATPRRRRWFRECGVLDGWRDAKLAADWLRARYGTGPWLRVRADWSMDSGRYRRVFLVTNCRSVTVFQAHGQSRRLNTPQPGLYMLDLVFDGAPLRVVGSHAQGAVETGLRPWGPAVRLGLAVDLLAGTGRPCTSPPVARCTLQVYDVSGETVQGYEGDACIRFDGAGSVRASVIGGDRLPVHAGRAVFYVEQPVGGLPLRVSCALEGLPPITQTLFLES